MTKGLPPLIKQKLSNKEQYKYYNIKLKLYTDDRNCNDWKFQLYWNKLEWVNPRKKLIQLLQRNTILIKTI